MFHWKHRRSRAALRCASALLGLIFLTAQLSGKFYVWSSQAIFSRTTKSVSPGIHSTDPRILSLDKRYKAQKMFTLLIQPVQHEFSIVPPIATGCLPPSTAPNLHKIIPTVLRGPPATA